MTKVRFVGEPDRLASSFGHLCEWAEQIDICTARFDGGDDRSPFPHILGEGNKDIIDKVRHFIVTKRDDPPTELKPFHDRGVLRFVVDQRSRFRPNIYLFRKADEVRALVGTVRLTPASFRSDLEAMMLVEGSWHDEFACELRAFIDRCLKSARVSRADDFLKGPDEFLAIEDLESRARIVWVQLLGLGPFDKDSSVREAAQYLKAAGVIDFKRLDSAGTVYGAILEAIQHGARIGLFDRPSRGMVRAILRDASEYPEWLWDFCLVQALDDQERYREEAIRRAAEWTAHNVGLAYRQIRTGGRIESALKRAISRCIRSGDIERCGPSTIRRVARPADGNRRSRGV